MRLRLSWTPLLPVTHDALAARGGCAKHLYSGIRCSSEIPRRALEQTLGYVFHFLCALLLAKRSCVSCNTEVAEGGSQVLSKATFASFTAPNLPVVETCLAFPWLFAVKYNCNWTIVD